MIICYGIVAPIWAEVGAGGGEAILLRLSSASAVLADIHTNARKDLTDIETNLNDGDRFRLVNHSDLAILAIVE